MTDTAKPTKKRIEVVELIGAQALDVYDATGLTPRQLQLERINLIVALHNIADIEDAVGGGGEEIDHARSIARHAIAKCKAKP